MSRVNEYVERLRRLGFKPHNAVRMCEVFYKDLNEDYLDAVVNSLEADNNVEGIQSKSVR